MHKAQKKLGLVPSMQDTPLSTRRYRAVLQELLQALHPEAPEYEIVSESGPDHRRVFQARVCWRGEQLATGKGKSKKDAEARAAGEALRAKSWQ